MRKKSAQPSVDGFVPRQAGARVGVSSRSLGQAASKNTLQAKEHTRPLQTARSITRADVDESLRAIDDEPAPAPKKRGWLRRRSPKPPSRRRKIMKRVALALLIVVVVLAGYFGWKFLVASGNVLGGNWLGFLQNARLKEDKYGRTNVVIFGTSGWSMKGDDWDGAMLTDSIMVVSVDQDENDVYTISLPRDLYVGTCTETGKLNEIYWCAQQAGKSDREAAVEFQQKAGDILGIDVHYYVHANWKALVQGVNAVGGVDVKITGSEGNGIYDVATNLRYSEGEVAHLNGEKALALARARGSSGGYGLSGGNFDREKNQQKVLAALQKKATSASTLANPVAVSGLMDALGDNLRTNFKTNETQALINLAKNMKKTTSLPLVGRKNNQPDLVTTGSLPGSNISIVQPTAGIQVYDEIHAYIAKHLRADFTATIDVLNASNITGRAQTKADSLAASGYTIGTVANAPKSSTKPVRIFQLNKDKAKVATALKDRYEVAIEKEALSGYTPSKDADFVIVFGGS